MKSCTSRLIMRRPSNLMLLLVAIILILLFIKITALLLNHANNYRTKDYRGALRLSDGFNETNKEVPGKKSHVFYVHYLNSRDENTVQNFLFFIQFAYSPCNRHISFTFVFNTDRVINVTEPLVYLLGQDAVVKMINCESNTQIIARVNKPGGDLCAHVEQLQSSKWMTKEEKKYDYYFFINSSVRGPFIPAYYLKQWWDMFLDMFEKFPRAAAVGPYLSCEYNPHIQSFIVALDKRGLSVLKEVWRCPYENETRPDWIKETEVKLGAAIIKRGFEMQNFISKYHKDGSIPARCYPHNPTISYPVTQQEKMSIYGVRETPDVSINVHEVVWVKYGGHIDYNQYIRDYIPLYTHWAYQNIDLMSN